MSGIKECKKLEKRGKGNKWKANIKKTSQLKGVKVRGIFPSWNV